MTLTNEESGLIVDYVFRCADQRENERVSDLLASDPVAAEIYSCIKKALSQLDCMEDECCPDKLVDMTMARLKLAEGKQSFAP